MTALTMAEIQRRKRLAKEPLKSPRGAISLPAPGRGVNVHVTISQDTYAAVDRLAAERGEFLSATLRAILEAVAEQILADYLAEKARRPAESSG